MVLPRKSGKHSLERIKNYSLLLRERTMASCTILYWRDIPAQVIVKKRRNAAKRELSLRFTEAIDMCAMRTGAAESEDYLAEWRKGEPIEVSDDLEQEAEQAAVTLEEEYTKDMLVALVNSEGWANK